MADDQSGFFTTEGGWNRQKLKAVVSRMSCGLFVAHFVGREICRPPFDR